MSVGDYLIVALLMVGFFWIVGKIFIGALKFVLVAALGAVVVAAVVLSPIWLVYGAGIAVFGAWSFVARHRMPKRGATLDIDEVEP